MVRNDSILEVGEIVDGMHESLSAHGGPDLTDRPTGRGRPRRRQSIVYRPTSPTDKDGESKQTDGGRAGGRTDHHGRRRCGNFERRAVIKKEERRKEGRSDVISINFRASLRFFVGKNLVAEESRQEPRRQSDDEILNGMLSGSGLAIR